ncbi:hypothetical protein, partial [Tepidimonas sp.]|uniref:hypothetical protein n=1 Tax=Tepidimonas sp. TaxID=2002775 RepID=UPI00391D833E
LQPHGPKAKHGTFAVYEPGDVHIDVYACPDGQHRDHSFCQQGGLIDHPPKENLRVNLWGHHCIQS